MKHRLLLPFLFLIFSSFSFAQNVGIGTSNPDEKLDVNGRIKIQSTAVTSDSANVLFNNNGNLYWQGVNLGNQGSGFNGSRPITQTAADPSQAGTVGGTTIIEFLNNYFFPSQAPLVAIVGDGATTIEMKSTLAPAVTRNLTSFTVTKQAATLAIDSAMVTCNQAVPGFPINFNDHSGGNQSGSQSGVALIDNVTNTFTCYGRAIDGKSATATKTYTFASQRYWGITTNSNPTVDNAFILGLTSSNFSAYTAAFAFTISSGSQYCVMAFPHQAEDMSAHQWFDGSFRGTYFRLLASNFSFTNASGYTTGYDVYITNLSYTSTKTFTY